MPERLGGKAASSAAGDPSQSGNAVDLSGQSSVAASRNGEGEDLVVNGYIDRLAAHPDVIRSLGHERECGTILDDCDATGRKRDVARMPASDPCTFGHRPVGLAEFCLKSAAKRG